MSDEVPDDIPDEIRVMREGWRLLGNDVPSELIARGWAVTDLTIADDEPLEFYWPPTAPASGSDTTEHPHETPWLSPTRISRTATGWRVEYGEATAQQPDATTEHSDDAALISDLERIECWPMTVEETVHIRMQRVYTVTTAAARDDHYQACTITEPYSSRMNELVAHLRHDAAQRHGLPTQAQKPTTPRPRGSISDQLRLIDGEAWASAIRTARAGGDTRSVY